MSTQEEKDFVRAFFPTFISFAVYSRFAEERETLIQTVYEIRREDEQGGQQPGKKYNVGYTSYFTRNTLQDNANFKNVVAFINEKARNFATFLKFDLQHHGLVMTSFWININPKYSFHGDHIHPRAHFSGVFYVQCPKDSGDILFKDPREVRLMFPPYYAERAETNADTLQFPPKEGGLIIFPAWLNHSVSQNVSEGDRVSLSFNFRMYPLPSERASPKATKQ